MSEAALPEKMTAIVQSSYGGTEVWAVQELPLPRPGKGEVLLAVAAAGIDRGTWHLMTGRPQALRLAFGLRRPRQPVPGLDVAGSVIATGPGVTALEVGQEVFGIAQGSLAPYAVARVTKLAPVPTGLRATEAAVLGVSGLTALQALDAADLAAGQRLLVTGASGGVGSFVVKLAAVRGIEVTAVCSAAKREAVLAWGATRVLDYASDSIGAEVGRFDAVVDIAGGTPLAQLRQTLTENGAIIWVGHETDGALLGGYATPMWRALRMRRARQRFVMLASREDGADLARLGDLVEAGLRPHVHQVYPLADAAAAMEDLAAGRVCGKVAIEVAAVPDSGPAS